MGGSQAYFWHPWWHKTGWSLRGEAERQQQWLASTAALHTCACRQSWAESLCHPPAENWLHLMMISCWSQVWHETSETSLKESSTFDDHVDDLLLMSSMTQDCMKSNLKKAVQENKQMCCRFIHWGRLQVLSKHVWDSSGVGRWLMLTSLWGKASCDHHDSCPKQTRWWGVWQF